MELEVRRTTGSSAKGIKRSIGISYIVEPFLVGLCCLIGTDQFDILLFHTDISIKFQYYILQITVILTLLGSVLINFENNFILNIFYFSYTMLLVIIHLSRVKFIYSFIFGLVFLVLDYFLLELKTDNFANYFILHVGVLHFLIIALVKTRINSAFIITLHTICIGYSMTLIIIHSCSYYSKYNSGLVWFVLGLFTARSLPQLLWSFRDGDLDREIQVQSFSESLAIWRFVFCFVSFIMKLTMGKANFYTNSEGGTKYFEKICDKLKKAYEPFCDKKKDFKDNFKELYKHTKDFYMFNNENCNNNGECSWCMPFLEKIFYLCRLYPFFSFIFTGGFILKSPPLTHLIYCPYSSHQKLIIDNINRISFLIGCCFGAAYPASVTGNHYYYYIITFSVYLSHIVLSVTLAYIGQFLSLYILYTIASLSGFFLGYTFSYSLGAFTNSILIQTCRREEFDNPFTSEKTDEKLMPCCGDKFNNECYCKYPSIIPVHQTVQMPLRCSKSIFECRSLKYDPNGCNAIIICDNDAKITNCTKSPCEGVCCTETDCKCLRLLGVYKLEAVSTSACAECQLTVRIEGTKLECNSCGGTCSSGNSGGTCNCQNGDGTCCLCVKCCDKGCCTGCSQEKCCCIKFCCCKNGCKSCKCKCNGKKKCCNECNGTNSKGSNGNCSNGKDSNGNCSNGKGSNGKEFKIENVCTRIFICYKNCANNGDNCCLRELKPNSVDFDGMLDKFECFDIRYIFFRDCCHVDMQIDLHCSLRNNYFRLNGVNYPKKSNDSKTLKFYGRILKSCKQPEKQCCCLFRKITKLFLSPEDCDPEKKCSEDCTGSSGGCCTCPNCLLFCRLKIDKSGSFVKRVDKFRVKFIVISFVIFALVCLMIESLVMISRYRNRPAIFNPNATYEQITKLVEKKNFNSVEQVSARLTSLMNVNKIAEGANDEKINHFKKMSEVLKKHMSEPEYLKLYSHLENVSLTFLSRSNRTEFKSLEKQVILWSHCVGFFYGYAFPLFTFIQEFFTKWDMMWNIEHENYIRVVRPRLNKMSHLSKYSLTLLDVLTTSDKTVRSIGMTRTSSWVGVMEELKWAVKLDETEKGVSDLPLATSMGEKLERFLKAWLHRQTYVGSWITKKTNVFDWAGFTSQYENIEKWIEQVSPYLMLGSEYVNIQLNELNQEVKS
ncbi:uncharacterized protein TA14025 [Theileria annulata]|uniref:Uncharacterized protein n=1 Tax=Theileria annulata TaxID=5874 RepID=Q4UEU6_THEAN|nr:uncharacterized protein TA14025 [Theileria annulata]CAI74393.1 hypothetical protein TA14025 [Theileria annulata]|eukprot:XP_952125.1 hypothetical protein TA14025 [Theileria annulata]